MAALERVGEGVLLPNAAASDIEGDRAILHLRDFCGSEHAASLVCQRRVHRDHVRLREKLVERDHFRADFFADGRRDVRIVGDDVHSECSRARGNARADASESDDAKGLAAQLESHELRSHPFTALDARIGRRNVAAEREQHRHRVLGRGEDVRGRRVDD